MCVHMYVTDKLKQHWSTKLCKTISNKSSEIGCLQYSKKSYDEWELLKATKARLLTDGYELAESI